MQDCHPCSGIPEPWQDDAGLALELLRNMLACHLLLPDGAEASPSLAAALGLLRGMLATEPGNRCVRSGPAHSRIFTSLPLPPTVCCVCVVLSIFSPRLDIPASPAHFE